MAAAASQSSKINVSKKMAAAPACSCLPEELWERIFKFLNDDDVNKFYSNIDEYGRLVSNLSAVSLHECFESLSVVSKQFLSITNRLRFSVTISDQTIPFLDILLKRFPNVTSLNITLEEGDLGDLDALLTQISTFPVELRSLALYQPISVPENGLLALSKKMKNLTSLFCYRFSSKINKNDLFFIADCFPLLEELVLTDTGYLRSIYDDEEDDDDDQLLALPKLRKIALSPIFKGRQSISDLCENCDLQEVRVIEDLPLPGDIHQCYCACGFDEDDDIVGVL